MHQPEQVVGEGDEVDAAVLIEALVLGVEQRPHEQWRHLIQADGDQAALPELRDQRLILGVNPQRRFQLHMAIALRCRNLRVQI